MIRCWKTLEKYSYVTENTDVFFEIFFLKNKARKTHHSFPF